jgi:hypothetical protein
MDPPEAMRSNREVVSKPQIRFVGKAPVDENAQSRRRRDEPKKETGNAAQKP